MVIELLMWLLICCVFIELLCGYWTNKNKMLLLICCVLIELLCDYWVTFITFIHLFIFLFLNVWSLNYWYGYWSVVYLLNCCVLIELLCGYWTNKNKISVKSIYWAILVYGNHVFPLNCPLCARSVSFVYCRRSLHLCDRHPFGCL